MREPAAPHAPDEDVSSVDRAIAALESQRAVLGDEVVDTALSPLRERRAALAARHTGEQRKLVTVLFADLVGFTALSRTLDAEVTRELVAVYFARWRDAITAHGGTVEKFIGDAVMAVFGLHQSWEDDAQRAVRAALAMTSGLTDLNAELRQQHGVELHMRVGVDTGEVVVGTLEERTGREFVAVGPTVNRASRLQAAAPEDRVLISADTHRQIRGWFSMEQRHALQLKGIDDPVDAYLVVSERPHGFRLDRGRGVEGVDTSTVGREPELRYLQERLWDVVEEQRWRVVTIVGDAGVGKSRLLLDFDSWLGERPEPVWWFRGRASQAGQNRPNALLHDLVASRFQIHESDSPDVVRAKFDEGFATASEEPHDAAQREAQQDARLVAAWLGFDVPREEHGDGSADAAALPTDPQSLRDRATQALAEFLARLSRTAPVVLLLEDLHWADDGSLRWLDAADALLHQTRVLVVATSRATLFEERPHWGEGLDHHVRLPLAALSGRESRLLLDQILRHVEHPPAALVDLVIDASEGNPFYIEELVTWFVDAGVIVKGSPSWHVVDDLVTSIAVPSTLRGVLQARLDALSPSERGILQRASVVGRVFWDDAVRHLDGPYADVPEGDTLDGLRRRELVFEREVSSFDSAREFLFKHALLRDVAYEGVLRSHRERYHRLTATWLAEVSARSGRDREYAALIADHFDRAGDPDAAVWYLRAGQQAARVYALEEATRLLSRALDVVGDTDAPLRFDVLAEHEDVLERVGDRSAEQADLQEMEALAAGLDDDQRQVTLLLAKSRLTFERSEYDDTLRWTAEAVQVAERAGLRARIVEAELWRGKALTWSEHLDDARASLQAAHDLAEELDLRWLMGEALRYLAMVANNSGDYPTALALIARSRDAFALDGDTEAESMALGMYASTCFNMGRIEEARTTFEQLLAVFRRSGHRYREAVCLGNLGSIASSQGQLAQAERWCLEAAELTRRLDDREGTVANIATVGELETLVGRYERAEEHLAEALELARSSGSAAFVTTVLSRQALLAVERGDPGQALALAEEATAAAHDAPSPLEQGAAAIALGYAHQALGGYKDAAAAFEAARAAYISIDRPTLLREADAGLAAATLPTDPAAALERVRPILAHVDAAGLMECLRPTALLHNVWLVLDRTGDPAVGRLLADVGSYLTARAEAIGDDEMAAGYLAGPMAAELLRLAEDRASRLA